MAAGFGAGRAFPRRHCAGGVAITDVMAVAAPSPGIRPNLARPPKRLVHSRNGTPVHHGHLAQRAQRGRSLPVLGILHIAPPRGGRPTQPPIHFAMPLLLPKRRPSRATFPLPSLATPRVPFGHRVPATPFAQLPASPVASTPSPADIRRPASRPPRTPSRRLSLIHAARYVATETPTGLSVRFYFRRHPAPALQRGRRTLDNHRPPPTE